MYYHYHYILSFVSESFMSIKCSRFGDKAALKKRRSAFFSFSERHCSGNQFITRQGFFYLDLAKTQTHTNNSTATTMASDAQIRFKELVGF